MKTLMIKKYSLQDKSSLIELLKLNVPLHFAQSEIADFEQYLEHNIEQYFIVFLDQKAVAAGGINFDNNFTIGKISWDFVHPEYQGKGIGKLLLEHRLNILNTMPNVTQIKVRTSQLAYLFYQKNGFMLEEIIKDYWANGFDLYSMYYPIKSK